MKSLVILTLFENNIEFIPSPIDVTDFVVVVVVVAAATTTASRDAVLWRHK